MLTGVGFYRARSAQDAGTAYRNMLKRYSAKAVLERELERLTEEWSK
jgi:hypothetical protein